MFPKKLSAYMILSTHMDEIRLYAPLVIQQAQNHRINASGIVKMSNTEKSG